MNRPLLAFFVAAVLSAVCASSCGSGGGGGAGGGSATGGGAVRTCSAANCDGCCDSADKCRAPSASACGQAGGSCGVCGAGTECRAGVCQVAGTGGSGGSSGGGSGGTGGGAATGGGTGATGGGAGGCRNLPTFNAVTQLNADYLAFSRGFYHTVKFVGPAPVGVDGVEFQLVYYTGQLGPVVPLTRQLAVNSVATCDVCAIFYENCDSQGTCAHTYLGRSGTVSVTRADRDVNAGRMIGSASNLRFDEWNLGTDKAEPGGLCVTVGSVPSFNGAWNFDGGQPPP